jgi:beta-carotene hydroxylase
VKTDYYTRHTRALRKELAVTLDRAGLRALHEKRPLRHFFVLGRQLVLLGSGILGAVSFRDSLWWVPFAALEGLTIFNFTVLLHEVLHGLVFRRRRSRATTFLGLLYAIPAGISPLQFTRWHLDHHAELGSWDGDPKRHHLSPKLNRRWYKALYFTPALFFLYFRAASRETASYPLDVQTRIARERAVSSAFQLSVTIAIWFFGGWGSVVKAYLIPVFVVFPVAFALNRLGQHYDIRPEDPAQWTTLVKPSWFWDHVFLWSNYHLEHHYFPGVPFYNLPKLHRLLAPFFAERGIRPRSYSRLLYQYLVLNKAPHTNWSLP